MRLKPVVEEAGEGLGLPREGSIESPPRQGETISPPRQGGIEWHVDMDDTLMVDADHEHLFRVISNLARNAMQAIEQQGPVTNGQIKVKGRREGRMVVIEISDNGPGIPEHQRAKLFKAFQGSNKKGGTGLGLVIASELVAAHGGTLRLLETTPGATFRIELPDRVVK